MKNICFTGHRNIKISDELIAKLVDTLCDLIEQHGAENFYSGGAVGWDTVCAQTVLKLRRSHPHIRLHLILPCSEAEQTASWNISQKQMYNEILAAADSVEYVSQHYYDGCMKKRNTRLVEASDCCVCYYDQKRSASGTGQTVRMALKKHIRVINIYT